MENSEFKDKIAAGTLTRREMNKALASVGLTAVTMTLMPRGVKAEEEQAIYFT